MSEFGQGTTYCLGLFLAHQERYPPEYREKKGLAELWFNGASDHFYDLIIPENYSDRIKRRLKKLQEKALNWGHGFPPKSGHAKWEDVEWALKEAKMILRYIDEFHGIEVIKGRWE